MKCVTPIKSEVLREFAESYLADPVAIPTSVLSGVTFVGDFAEIVLFREGQFQVQMCLCKPNSHITDHAHPNVDSVLIYVTGELGLTLGGQLAFDTKDVRELEDGTNSHNGYAVSIPAGMVHGAVVGPMGGAFITLQHWLSGTPTSVEKDWVGEPLSGDHNTEALK